jgi:imidazolonepropionase-like amidohydrolase
MKALFLAIGFAGVLAAQATVLIKNATVHTITNGTLQNTSILVRDGKIAEIGANILVPNGAKVIDASGMHVMPGIIDSHVHYPADAINEGSVAVSSMVAISDVINAEQISIYRALAGGVTTANLLHGSANPIGGLNAVVKMRWGKDAQGLLFEGAMPGIKFALGENPKRQGQGGQTPFGAAGTQPLRYPGTRMGVEDVIRESFNKAKIYQASWKDYDARKARGEDVQPPRRDLKLEPLVEVLEGKRLVHAHCYRSDEILMLLRVADDYGFKIATLQHVLEGYKVAKEIAAHGAGASVLTDWYAYKVEANDATPYNPAIMAKKGVLVAVHSDDLQAELTRRLNLEAAKAVKYGGVTEDEALAMITINPAKMLRIEKWVGSLEVGKVADIAIFDKHPLSSYAKVQKVLVDGTVYFDRDNDNTERGVFDQKKQSLIQREKEAEKRAPTVPPAKRTEGPKE